MQRTARLAVIDTVVDCLKKSKARKVLPSGCISFDFGDTGFVFGVPELKAMLEELDYYKKRVGESK